MSTSLASALRSALACLPRPTETATFWDKRAEKYAQQPIKDTASYEKTLERVRAHRRALGELGVATGLNNLAALYDAAQLRINGCHLSDWIITRVIMRATRLLRCHRLAW